MLTHLDVLNDVDKIKLALRYKLKEDNNEEKIFHKSLPNNVDDWEKMEPEYIEMPGWKQLLTEDTFNTLPTEAQSFVR